MEFLESLLPLIIFAVYFLLQLRRKRSAAPPPDGEVPTGETPASPRRPTPFEDLLRQIQEAAEGRPAAEQPVAVEHFPSTSVPVPEPVPQARLERRPPTEFKPVGEFEHEQHSFGAENPFSEEVFEQQPLGAPPPPHRPGHLNYDPHALRPSPPPSMQAPLRNKNAFMRDLVARLHAPSGAREALAIKAILDPPLSRQPRRGPGSGGPA